MDWYFGFDPCLYDGKCVIIFWFDLAPVLVYLCPFLTVLLLSLFSLCLLSWQL